MIQKKVYTVKIKPNIGLLVVLLVMISFGCAEREQGTTHSGKLVAVEFEHRNVVEHRGEGGPEISLLSHPGAYDRVRYQTAASRSITV